MNKTSNRPWTTVETRELIDLWPTAKVSELAKRLSKSVDAIYSKARYLDLPPRKKLTPRAPFKAKARKASPAKTTQVAEAEAVYQPPKAVNHPLWEVGPHDCRWPMGDPGKPGFHFCRKPVHGEHSYCQDHRQKAYHSHVVHRLQSRTLESA